MAHNNLWVATIGTRRWVPIMVIITTYSVFKTVIGSIESKCHATLVQTVCQRPIFPFSFDFAIFIVFIVANICSFCRIVTRSKKGYLLDKLLWFIIDRSP